MWRLIIGLIVFASPTLFAGSKVVLESDVILYSGPSIKYRPVWTGKKGDSFPISKRQVQGKEGEEYYKVLIKRKGPARVGYIPVSAAVHVEGTAEEADVDSYTSFAQANSAFQVGFHSLKDYQFLWTFGFLKYPSEDFYLKALVGQLLNQKTGSLVLGGEVGTDQQFINQFSLYALFSTGVFLLGEDDQIFQGSRKLNYFAQGGTGFRYTADEHAAVSLGLFQIALFSPNNSLLSLGASVTLEVGL